MSVMREELIAARRRAEAYHVLWVIGHDGRAFTVTIGHPDHHGVGADNLVHYADTLEEAQRVAAEAHDRFVLSQTLGRLGTLMPALRFEYTEAAKQAGGIL